MGILLIVACHKARLKVLRYLLTRRMHCVDQPRVSGNQRVLGGAEEAAWLADERSVATAPTAIESVNGTRVDIMTSQFPNSCKTAVGAHYRN